MSLHDCNSKCVSLIDMKTSRRGRRQTMLDAPSDAPVIKLRCPVFLADKGRYCNRVLDKLWISYPESGPSLIQTWGPSDRPGPISKPEIDRPLIGEPGDEGTERRRFKCNCGRSYTYTHARLLNDVQQAIEENRTDLPAS